MTMTKTFRCIPAIRMLTLAVKAGHINDMPMGDKQHIVESQQHKYILFALAVCEALEQVNYDSMMLDMEFIAKMAKEHGGWVEYDMFAEPSGIVNVPKMIASQQQGVFFERFAHLIAAELKGAK